MSTRAPLVPANVDLRDFPCMMVDIVRLFGSEFHAMSDDAAWRAGVTLWLKSFHQVPAASIPNDDVGQARLAELGKDLKSWKKIREKTLRGWILCSDGRLYHPVVAEKVLEAWLEKIGQRKSSAAGNAKRYNQIFDPKPFDAETVATLALLKELNPNSRALAKRLPRNSQPTPDSTPDGSPEPLPLGSQGKGREGKGNIIDNNHPSPTTPEDGEREFDEFWELFPKDEFASRPKAQQAFSELTPGERLQAIAAIPALKAAKPTTHKLSPDRYLRERRFATTQASRPATGPPKIEVKRLSPQGDAWEKYLRSTRGKGAPWSNGKWAFDTEWPPTEEVA